MPMGVINFFEKIDIEHKERDITFFPYREINKVLSNGKIVASIVDSGERVGGGHCVKFLHTGPQLFSCLDACLQTLVGCHGQGVNIGDIDETKKHDTDTDLSTQVGKKDDLWNKEKKRIDKVDVDDGGQGEKCSGHYAKHHNDGEKIVCRRGIVGTADENSIPPESRTDRQDKEDPRLKIYTFLIVIFQVFAKCLRVQVTPKQKSCLDDTPEEKYTSRELMPENPNNQNGDKRNSGDSFLDVLNNLFYKFGMIAKDCFGSRC